MKKIPTLFKREFQDHRVISISPKLSSPDLAWVLAGEGVATEKINGACCAIIDGQFYKRYDAKNAKPALYVLVSVLLSRRFYFHQLALGYRV